MIINYLLLNCVVTFETVISLKIDMLECGVDDDPEVILGDVEIEKYPWIGIFYYFYHGGDTEVRSVTTVALIHAEFVVGCAADIGPIPKYNFRANSRILLGEDWNVPGREARNYILHPEYGETENTLALIQLKQKVGKYSIRPVCPPPDILRDPEFFVVKFKDEYDTLEKQIIPMTHVPGRMCKDFYVSANLYAKKMRPPHVVCAISLDSTEICVWNAGGTLVTRDSWGRWQLLGIMTRGPGCSAPSRYLDMLSYYPWIHSTIAQFQPLTITKINSQSYVLRRSSLSSRFGACDAEEKIDLSYRDSIVLRSSNDRFEYLMYNLTIEENLEITCMTLELVNASGSSEMQVEHTCPRKAYGAPCHYYAGTKFKLSVHLLFTDKCSFEVFIWGFQKEMELLDIMTWKWEEGTYYNDFRASREEYRGQTFMTTFGYEPLDSKMWVPDYDMWTTTEFNIMRWSSTTAEPSRDGVWRKPEPVSYVTRLPMGYVTRPKDKRKKKTTLTRPKKTKRTQKHNRPAKWPPKYPF